MIWPSIDKISAMTLLPDSDRYNLLKRSEIPALIEAITVWYASKCQKEMVATFYQFRTIQ
jgi:hypothetical protein